MRQDFSQVKAILWDLDGTLFKMKGDFNREYRKEVLKTVIKKLRISEKKASGIIEKRYQKFASMTKTLNSLGINGKRAVEKANWHLRKKYLKRDLKLTALFKKLKKFKHVIITNASVKSTSLTLKLLGLNPEIFKRIVTMDDVSDGKPSLEPFLKAIKYTGLKPEECLFVGDREKTEILPAKKIGMKTCLVWGKSKAADVSLPSVYEVVSLF